MKQFGRPVLGWLGLPALEPFETIIDYTHQRLVFIRLDQAGHRLAQVPAYTSVTTLPLIPIKNFGIWGLLARVEDTVTESLFIDTGAPNNTMDYTSAAAAHLKATNSDSLWTLDHLVLGGHPFDGVTWTD